MVFPANNFGGQEPGSDGEIATFCKKNYGVTFDMFSKISVKGDDIAPLYKQLTAGAGDEKLAGEVDWNFAKFLVGRDGKLVTRFKAKVKPEDPALGQRHRKRIESQLKQPIKSHEKQRDENFIALFLFGMALPKLNAYLSRCWSTPPMVKMHRPRSARLILNSPLALRAR